MTSGFTANYTPGGWSAVTTESGWLMADLPLGDERLMAAAHELRAGGTADTVLEVLLRDGLTGVPPMVLVTVAGDDLRVVTRQPGRAVIHRGGEAEALTAGGSWLDTTVALPVDRVDLDGGSSVAGPALPIGLGVIPAGGITLRPAGTSAAVSDDHEPEATAPAAPTNVSGPPAGSTMDEEPVARDYSALFAGTEDRDAFLARIAAEQAAADDEGEAAIHDVDSDPPAPTDAATTGPEDPAEPAAGHTEIWQPPGESEATLDGVHTEEPMPSAAPGPEVGPSSPGIIDEVPWLSTSTPPSSAAEAPPPTRPSPLAPAPAHTPPPTPPAAPPPQPPPPPAHPSPAPPPPPREATPPPPPPPATPPSDPGESPDESDIRTMNRAELLASLQRRPVAGPSVFALHCSGQHPTPPFLDRCRVCGVPVPPGEPVEIARPPLGELRRDAAEPVVLDRDLVLGRAPRATSPTAAEQPNLVKVADPGISRNHVQITLKGWQVMVRDLDSANGTEIQLPGHPVEQLRAGEDYLIEPGTTITLASDVRFTFEATP